MKFKTLPLLLICLLVLSCTQNKETRTFKLLPFGEGGTKKMTYDRRQRPQALLMDDNIFLVYNGGAPADAVKLEKTVPFVTSYNLKEKVFSTPIQLPGVASKDHHYGPVIWADNNNFLHVLSGCHRTPGTHVVSSVAQTIGAETGDWQTAPQVAPTISYPSVSSVFNRQQLIYYRTGGHRSTWTYSITNDNGTTWRTPERAVVDFNNMDELSGKDHKDMDESSSYHTYQVSEDGKWLHIAFMYYDDNKGDLPEKAYNPLYKKDVGTLKTNLYYVKVDLESDIVYNFEGEVMKTPILLKEANEKCRIWDTEWRGSGVPPDIVFDKNNDPAFLHVLTEEVFEKLNYYYVRRVGNEWKQTVIAPACNIWNSCHLSIDDKGVLHAYLLMDDAYFKSEGKGVMNSHGGGTRLEEWISVDHGETWTKSTTLFKAEGEFAGWRFNNIQPVKTKEGKIQEGMWLFYGWQEEKDDVAQARAFLLLEK